MSTSSVAGKPRAALPPQVHVFVRDWLSGNNIVLKSRDACVVVDSGYGKHVPLTLALIASRMGLDGRTLAKLVNTHCHSDHMGGNAAVVSQYGSRITIPAGEVKNVAPWTPQSVWMEEFDQRADPFHFDDTIDAGQSFEGGGFRWQAYAAPGHDMDALMFFEPVNRILISGDALWENAMGFVWPEEGANPFIDAARETLATIERLEPSAVIPGHGAPFVDAAGAIARVRDRLDAFARDPAKNARHVMKSMFVFALLDKRSMPLADVPGYVARVPCYRRVSERFLGVPPEGLAEWLVGDLLRSGAISVTGGVLRPNAIA